MAQTQTTLNVLCFRLRRGSRGGGGQARVSLPGWSGPVNVYDLNQPNPTGLFKGIENDLQGLLWLGIGNRSKSRQLFKSVVVYNSMVRPPSLSVYISLLCSHFHVLGGGGLHVAFKGSTIMTFSL